MDQPDPTVVERIRRVRNDLAPAERRVVETLLAHYPTAGLGSIAQLAAAAGTSGPTVLRLLGKLGFDGYPAFRERLRGEVAARLFSSDGVYPAAAQHPLGQAERAFAENLRATFRDPRPRHVGRRQPGRDAARAGRPRREHREYFAQY